MTLRSPGGVCGGLSGFIPFPFRVGSLHEDLLLLTAHGDWLSLIAASVSSPRWELLLFIGSGRGDRPSGAWLLCETLLSESCAPPGTKEKCSGVSVRSKHLRKRKQQIDARAGARYVRSVAPPGFLPGLLPGLSVRARCSCLALRYTRNAPYREP